MKSIDKLEIERRKVRALERKHQTQDQNSDSSQALGKTPRMDSITEEEHESGEPSASTERVASTEQSQSARDKGVRVVASAYALAMRCPILTYALAT
eukprot:3553726-Rhodomonas_salina.2